MVPEPFILRVVDKNTLQSIHEQSLQLLARAGVIFDNETIIRRFSRKGQQVDGKRVYLSEALVSEALEMTPKSFNMIGRNDAEVRIGENQETTVVAPGNGTLFIQDMKGRRRPATLTDFDNIVKLCENSRNVNLVGSIPVDPSDLPAQFKPGKTGAPSDAPQQQTTNRPGGNTQRGSTSIRHHQKRMRAKGLSRRPRGDRLRRQSCQPALP